MRISDVTAYTLSSPVDPVDEREFLGGIRRIHKRDVVLLRVTAADGEIGVATAGASSSEMKEYFEDVDHDNTAAVLEDVIGPVLTASPLETIAEATDRIRAETDLPDHIRREAASAIDVALHDLKGRQQGVPVYELLITEEETDGGYTLDLPLYASAGMYMEPEGYATQAKALAEQGFFGYKYRPGGGPDRDLETIAAIHDAVGGEMEIMVDAHTWWKLGERSYDVDQVVDLLEEFSTYDPYWVEEPVRPAAHDDYVAVAERTDVPLAGGESEPDPAGLQALADTGAVSFLQADVRHHGGFTGCWEVAEYCVGRDVRFVPHNFGTNLGLVANAHLVAAAPEAELLEYPVFGRGVDAMYPFPLAEDILATDLDLENGRLGVPTGPGLGIEVDFDVVEQYPHVEGPWTEFEYE